MAEQPSTTGLLVDAAIASSGGGYTCTILLATVYNLYLSYAVDVGQASGLTSRTLSQQQLNGYLWVVVVNTNDNIIIS